MLATSLVFLLPVLYGGLLVHLLWDESSWPAMLFKAFLGIGIGLGLWSLSFFAYLLAFTGQNWFILFEVAALGALLLLTFIRNRRHPLRRPSLQGLSTWSSLQKFLVALGAIVFTISLFTSINYLLRRRQGDWDAWMMYNRAARFVYLDQTHWRESFSRAMDPIFHPDYPLMLAMNIASGWDTVGRDTPHVPMVQSALFAIACAGLITSALALVKSVGQAALGVIILWGVPVFVNEGAREMADVPLAFFLSATGILLYLYHSQGKAGLLVLAGITAGLAAWTKNEGAVVVLGASVASIVICLRQRGWRPLLWYAVGLCLPMAIVMYFKFFLAPPGDILSRGPTDSLAHILDPSRHLVILQYFWQEIVGFGNWGIPPLAIGILPILLIFYFVFREPATRDSRAALLAGWTILVIQMVGYYVAYLITPYELAWHLSFSTTRIVVQVFPLLAFLILCAATPVENVMGPRLVQTHGANHASGN